VSFTLRRRTGDFEEGCNGTHAVTPVHLTPSGFDIGRIFVVQNFVNGGHDAEGKLWGNTDPMRQCDDEWAESDGIGVVVANNHRHD
jgi:hypothetical protein